MITEDYVSFEIAKLLKEKGFDEPCDNYYDQSSDEPQQLTLDEMYYSYDEFLKAPTHQMAMKWLREVYNIIIEPESVWNGKKWEYQLFIVTPQNADSPYYEHNPYKSYEECVEAAIKYCLEKLL